MKKLYKRIPSKLRILPAFRALLRKMQEGKAAPATMQYDRTRALYTKKNADKIAVLNKMYKDSLQFE